MAGGKGKEDVIITFRRYGGLHIHGPKETSDEVSSYSATQILRSAGFKAKQGDQFLLTIERVGRDKKDK